MPPPTMPWADGEEAAFTRLLLHDEGNKPSFHRADLFHNVQMGQGKVFSASALVTLLPLVDGNSVDAKLNCIFEMYKGYCKES